MFCFHPWIDSHENVIITNWKKSKGIKHISEALASVPLFVEMWEDIASVIDVELEWFWVSFEKTQRTGSEAGYGVERVDNWKLFGCIYWKT